MNIETEKQVMVFRTDNEYGTFYNLGLSKKAKDGSYINGYMPCQFKKGVELENQTKIYIKKAWLTFYLKDKVTNPYVFISEFETLENTIKENHVDLNPYEEMGQEIQDDDLPF